MMFGRKRLTAATMLILVMNVFRGQTQSCHQSEYWTGKECCPMCPAGSRVKTDCTEFKTTSCLPCTEGTCMPWPTGIKQCYYCTNCDAGSGLKIKRACTKTSPTVCEPLEGFYCTLMYTTEEGCVAAQKHKLCQPGQCINQTGTSSRDTECSDCSDGTYSDGTFTSCQTHTQCELMNLQLIKPGTVSTDAECGEQSSDRTGIVIGIVVALLFLLIGAAVFILYHLKKRKKSQNPDIEGNANNHEQVPFNGAGASENVQNKDEQQDETDHM